MRYEYEMTQPVKSFLMDEYSVDSIEEEFSAGYGIADIVGIKCNKRKLKSRYKAGSREPIANIRELSVLNIMNQKKLATVDYLSKELGLSNSYLKNILLKSLINKGYVDKCGSEYTVVKNVFSFSDLVVSIEAKLTKWRDALGQAKRYQHYSNIVFVALPERTVKNIDRDLFRKNNIGVLSVIGNSVNIELKPRRIKPKTYTMHLFCNEFFLDRQSFLNAF